MFAVRETAGCAGNLELIKFLRGRGPPDNFAALRFCERDPANRNDGGACHGDNAQEFARFILREGEVENDDLPGGRRGIANLRSYFVALVVNRETDTDLHLHRVRCRPRRSIAGRQIRACRVRTWFRRQVHSSASTTEIALRESQRRSKPIKHKGRARRRCLRVCSPLGRRCGS